MIVLTTTNRLKFIIPEMWFRSDIIITNDNGVLTMVRSRWDEVPMVITNEELRELVYKDRTDLDFRGLERSTVMSPDEYSHDIEEY